MGISIGKKGHFTVQIQLQYKFWYEKPLHFLFTFQFQTDEHVGLFIFKKKQNCSTNSDRRNPSIFCLWVFLLIRKLSLQYKYDCSTNSDMREREIVSMFICLWQYYLVAANLY